MSCVKQDMPPPPTPGGTANNASLPIDTSTHEFVSLKKVISSPEHMEQWKNSKALNDILGFVITLNEAVSGKKISDEIYMSPMCERLITMLNTMNDWVTEIPPVDQPQRFGNKAFRTYFDRVKECCEDLLKNTLGCNFTRAVVELCGYLSESIGNQIRIDYGTGHELSFIAFLCCLFRIGALTKDDLPATVLRIFAKYLHLVRRLQIEYRMEPAGSHGVWSLDDFQFAPFIWGSSQLAKQCAIEPSSFVDKKTCENLKDDYLFFSCIDFIYSVKTGVFAEHSNTLWGISSVQSWTKINSGLIKMYKVEVLSKFPVIQHFLFGSILTLDPVT